MELNETTRLHSQLRNSATENEFTTQIDELNERTEKWAGKAESMLSILGYIVGLGNLWRFPYLSMRNGGGAFLIPFVVCIILIALPMFTIEIALGQFTARSTIHCWEACPVFKGVGYGMLFVNGLCCVYFVMVFTWTIYYLVNSFITPLPWSTCGNWWNTEHCVSDGSLTTINTSVYNVTNSTSSVEEFWQHNALDISSGIEDFGAVNENLMFCLMAAWFIIFLCLMKGIKTVGKVVYFTATLPYFLLTVLLLRASTLPGAREGVLFYITPNFERIFDVQVWTEAAIQVFYSTCIGWGPLITMASYNNYNNNCLRDSIILLTLGEGTSVFGGFVVFSVLGFMAQSSGVAIETIVRSGPGLVYVAYPEAISRLPLSNLWAVLFFIMVLTVSLDTQFGTVEPIITVLSDSSVFFRKRRVMLTALAATVCFLLGIPLCFQGGLYLFQLLDWYIAAFCIPIYGIIECVVFGWIYGAGNFSRDITMMTGVSVPLPLRVLWCFVTPVLLLVLLVVIILAYKPPNYGSYNYPPIANVFGLIFALIPIIPIPVLASVEVRKADGYTYLEKIKNALKPSHKWKPGHSELEMSYTSGRHQFSSFRHRITWNLFDR